MAIEIADLEMMGTLVARREASVRQLEEKLATERIRLMLLKRARNRVRYLQAMGWGDTQPRSADNRKLLLISIDRRTPGKFYEQGGNHNALD